MNIEKAHIYGFGKWKDFSILFDPQQVNILSGKNEAGKSTLSQFLLFVLFGLPPKQREFFHPRTGGTLGGHLVVRTEHHGKVLIERIHDRYKGKAVCRLENGEEYGEEWLQQLLSGVNRSVYESIFSFSSEDLTKLQHLTGDELGEVLLNIGLTGSDQIHQTEKWLEKHLNDRFKPKGKVPEINQQLQRVEELSRKLASAENDAGKYSLLQDERQRIVQEMKETDMKIKEKQKDSYHLEQVLNALPLIVEYHQVKEKHLAFDRNTPFPESGNERYQQLKEAMLPLESEKHRLEADIQEHEEALTLLKENRVPESSRNTAQRLLDQQPSYEHHVHDLEQLRKRTDSLYEQLQNELKSMNIPIKEDELKDYSLPFYIEETWRQLRDESRVIEREDENLVELGEELEKQQDTIKQRMDSLKKMMMSKDEAANLSRQIDDSYHTTIKNDSMQHRSLKKRQRLALVTMSFLLFGAGWLMTIITTIVKFGLGGTLLSAMTASGAYLIHRSIKEYQDSDDTHIYKNDDRLEQLRQKLQTYERNNMEWKYLEDQWKQTTQEEIRLDEKRKHILQRHRRVLAGINEQETIYPFLSSLHLDHWEKLYHLLSQVKEKSLQHKQLKEKLEQNEDIIRDMKTRLDQFFEDRNWEMTQKSDKQQWSELQQWMNQQVNVDNQWNHIAEKHRQAKEADKQLDRRIYTYDQKRKELFNLAGVDSEEEFYLQASQAEEIKENERIFNHLESQLEFMLVSEDQEAFEVWRKSPDESMLRYEYDRCKQDIQVLEESQRSLQQNLSDHRSTMTLLENSEQHSEYLHRLEVEKAKLQELSKEWAQFQIASKIIERTKSNYQETYLPQVMEKAQAYIARLTFGNYKKLHIETDTRNIMIENQYGQRFEIQELSRGTSDQLYVSFRLALGELMADTMGFPFIVDDAFVHFDETRLQMMLRILDELSRDHQVILLTWREDLVSYFNHSSTHYLQ